MKLDNQKSPANSFVDAVTACPCCGARAVQIISDRDGKTGGELITVSCSQCGLGRIDPLPSDQELADWYATQYRQKYKSAVQPALRHVLRAGRNALWRWEWLCQNSVWQSPSLDRPQKKTLDIGSSSGEFVYLLKTLGFQATGIEPHAGYATYAQNMLGIDIKNGTLQHCLTSVATDSLDLITMFHVLEHLPEPKSALRSIGEKLRPDGILYIEVPNATRLCSPHYMFFRAHTLYFTAKTLRNLLESSGYKVLAQSPDSSDNLSLVARFVKSETSGVSSDDSHPLVSAHRARRWVPYLMQQLRAGRPLEKWRTRKEEKRSAAQHANGLALLNDLYGQKLV